jgi:membrane protease YdiL (CAAX protease family)
MTATEAQPAVDVGLPLWFLIFLGACLPFTAVAAVRLIRRRRPPTSWIEPLEADVPLPPWPAWTGVILFAALQLSMFMAFAGYKTAAAYALVPSEPPGGIDMLSPGIFLAQLMPILIGLVVIRIAGRGVLATVGVRPGQVLAGIGYGVFAFLAVMPICYAALYFNSEINRLCGFPVTIHPMMTALQSNRDTWVLLLAVLQAGVLAAASEELIFRGVLFSSLIRQIGPVAAMVLVSVTFAFFHISNQAHAILPLTILSLVLCYTAYRTRSLLAPVVAHFLFNTVSLLTTFWGNR